MSKTKGGPGRAQYRSPPGSRAWAGGSVAMPLPTLGNGCLPKAPAHAGGCVGGQRGDLGVRLCWRPGADLSALTAAAQPEVRSQDAGCPRGAAQPLAGWPDGLLLQSQPPSCATAAVPHRAPSVQGATVSPAVRAGAARRAAACWPAFLGSCSGPDAGGDAPLQVRPGLADGACNRGGAEQRGDEVGRGGSKVTGNASDGVRRSPCPASGASCPGKSGADS